MIFHVGGNVLPLILGATGLLGGGGEAAASGGFDIVSILTAVLGGGLGSLLGGLVKKA